MVDKTTLEQLSNAHSLLNEYMQKRGWEEVNDQKLQVFLAEHKINLMVFPNQKGELKYSVDDRDKKKSFTLKVDTGSYSEAYQMAITKGLEILNERQ